MGGSERVVFAFRALGETAQASALPQRSDPLAPTGQDLVRVGLVADVPDDAVGRRVENVMQRDRQFDHAEPGAEMTARHRDRADRFGAQFVGELSEIALFQLAQIGGRSRFDPEAALKACSIFSPSAALTCRRRVTKTTRTPSLTSTAITRFRHYGAVKSSRFRLGLTRVSHVARSVPARRNLLSPPIWRKFGQ